MKNNKLFLRIIIFFNLQAFAQLYTDKVVGKKNEAVLATQYQQISFFTSHLGRERQNQ